MNRVNFIQTGGFPLETDTLEFMQQQYRMLMQLAALGGDNFILSGCIKAGSTVSDGFVVINGELLPFRGGLEQETIVVREDVTNREFENGTVKTVFRDRYVRFGTGSDAIEWATIVRLKDLKTFRNLPHDFTSSLTDGSETKLATAKAVKDLNDKKLEAEDLQGIANRLTVLEQIMSPFVGGGGMVLWNRPAAEIPAGWQEVVNWRGRLPMGWNPDDLDFDTVGEAGGNKTHTLTVAQLPVINLKWKFAKGQANDVYDGRDGVIYSSNPFGKRSADIDRFPIEPIGGGQAHPILNPYRIVVFIEYVGV